MKGKKVLVTGATGQVGQPFAEHHAAQNDVWAIARFGDESKKAALEEAGVTCRVVDLQTGEYGDLPQDFDYVFHFAVARPEGDNFDDEFRFNAEPTGLLMSYCRNAKAFFHCSTTGVYDFNGHNVLSEDSRLGDNHRTMFATYSIGKISTEAVVRFCAREFKLPTVIGRLCVPYGVSGWPFFHLMMMQHDIEIPVHTDAPSEYTLIHQDDINRIVPKLLDAASVPAATFNLCGQEHVSIEEWTAYISELTGLEAKLKPTTETLQSVKADNSKMQKVAGKAEVSWKQGIKAMVEAAGALK
ncbi:MAG: NAD(P)-dependent oxidoreductase [Pseudomonadales bacterium]|nr:NAD(P)-dependent oxidoreductase [Pseudomonadales bacterium]